MLHFSTAPSNASLLNRRLHRSFRLDTVKRADVVALTEECAKASGIPYVMDAGMEEAMAILNG